MNASRRDSYQISTFSRYVACPAVVPDIALCRLSRDKYAYPVSAFLLFAFSLNQRSQLRHQDKCSPVKYTVMSAVSLVASRIKKKSVAN